MSFKVIVKNEFKDTNKKIVVCDKPIDPEFQAEIPSTVPTQMQAHATEAESYLFPNPQCNIPGDITIKPAENFGEVKNQWWIKLYSENKFQFSSTGNIVLTDTAQGQDETGKYIKYRFFSGAPTWHLKILKPTGLTPAQTTNVTVGDD